MARQSRIGLELSDKADEGKAGVERIGTVRSLVAAEERLGRNGPVRKVVAGKADIGKAKNGPYWFGRCGRDRLSMARTLEQGMAGVERTG